MNDIDLTASRHILPGNDAARRVTKPPALPAEALAAYELAEAHEELGLTRMLHAAGALNDGDTQVMLAAVSGKVGRALRILTGGALVLALTVVGLVAGPSAGRAEAMEGPEPDPVAVTAPAVVPVTLSTASVTVRVPVTTVNTTPGGWHCAALYGPVGVLGRACGLLPTVTVPVVLGRYAPLGRTVVTAVDDVAPWTTTPARVVLDVRRPSAFQRGTFLDMGRGDLYVSAPLTMYSAPVGRYIPQQYSPVQVQVAGRHGWVTVATLTTTRYGVASGIVHLGGGPRVFRVARPAGATVWSTVGTTHRMSLLTEPVDVI